jgi:outer membrane protein OmpA-like peptidoglycan-associated protein
MSPARNLHKFTNGTVEVDVIKAAVREGILTIQIVSRNTGDENLKIGYGLENFYFLDQKAKKKYHVLRDSSGAWFVSPACDPPFAPQTDTVTVPPGGRTLNTAAITACLLAVVANPSVAQDEPPEPNGAVLREPRNAPLTIVGLDQGINATSLKLQTDVTGLKEAMTDLGAQVKRAEIRVDMPGDVLFDFDKTDLKPIAQETLKKLADIIRAKSKGEVQINGYTDSKGSDPHNQKLYEGRAESVKKWLTANGNVPSEELQSKGFGKTNPVASNTLIDGTDNPEGRARNRRVEVVIPTQ